MNKRILIVDDDINVREMLHEALTNQGYGVVTTASGEETLKLLKKENFKVMFVDLLLPGMQGLELCRRIRKRSPKTCLFAITGHASSFKKASQQGKLIDDCFLKPIDIDTFVKAAEYGFNKAKQGIQNYVIS